MTLEELKAAVLKGIQDLDVAHTDSELEHRKAFEGVFKLIERLEEFEKWFADLQHSVDLFGTSNEKSILSTIRASLKGAENGE